MPPTTLSAQVASLLNLQMVSAASLNFASSSAVRALTEEVRAREKRVVTMNVGMSSTNRFRVMMGV